MQPLAVFLALVFSFLLPISSTAATPRAVVEKQESFLSGGKKITVQTFSQPGKSRRPAILVLHSSAGTMAGRAEMEKLSRLYAEKGYVTFFVHYFDCTGTHFASARTINKKWPLWHQTVGDAMNFVAHHPSVNPKSIGIFGFSLGAYLAVSVGSEDARVKAIVEVAGGIFANNESHMRRMPPTLVLHGEADQRVPIRYSRELVQRIQALHRQPQVHYYPGEGHVLSPPAIADATTRSVKFFARYLPVK